MHPELFKIPFIHLPVNTFGLMMVVGFLAAVSLIRRLSRDITPNPQYITNGALYALIAGVVGARVFHVVHYFDSYEGHLLSVFAIWKGGLELYGALLTIAVIVLYLRYHKLPVRRYLDILAIGLMLTLVFGRIGCFMRGCCFGKPTNLPWAIRFPYASPAYQSQAYQDSKRKRLQPHLKLPPEFSIYNNNENGIPPQHLISYKHLSSEQKNLVQKGPYRCLRVHPTQLYSSANGALLCLILYLFWRRSKNATNSKNTNKLFAKPGCTFALVFILYGIARFLIEFLRDDNPFEYSWWAIYKGGTISQNLSIYSIILGAVLMVVFQKMKPDKFTARSPE